VAVAEALQSFAMTGIGSFWLRDRRWLKPLHGSLDVCPRTLKLGARAATVLAALLLWALPAAQPASAASVCTGNPGYQRTFDPPACWRAYSGNSPFNKALPTDPRLASDSSSIVHQMVSNGYGFPGGRHGMVFQSGGGGIPVYWSKPSDPLVTINCTALWGPGTCTGSNGVDINGAQIHIPSGAQPENQSDAHMVIADWADNAEYDFERASWSGPDQLTVAGGTEEPLYGSSAMALDTGADAGSYGLLAGLVRPTNLQAGFINHALVTSVPCTQGYVWPATGPYGLACPSIGQSSHSALAMGTLLQLNMTLAQIRATRAPRWEQTLMRAMAQYGLYVADTNGGGDNQTLELFQQDDQSFTSFGASPMMADFVRSAGGYYAGSFGWIIDGVPIDVSRLRVIAPCVQEGLCPSPPVATAAGAQSRHSHARGHRRKKRRHRRHR
jgi:hypothetical protein